MARSLMNNVRNRASEPEVAYLPPAPDMCGIPGCKNDSSLVMAKVSSGKGIEHRVASEVMDVNYFNGKMTLSMRDSYNFIQWFSRCDECLAKGMQRKRAKLRAEGEHEYYV